MLNEQDKKIEQYLNNEIRDEERQAFESEMKNDTELAKKVTFQKDLIQFFEERNPDLEKKLSELGNEFFVDNNEPPNTNGKNSNRKFGLFLLLSLIFVTAISSYFYFNADSNQANHDEIYNNPINAEDAINKGMLEDGGREGLIIDEPKDNIQKEKLSDKEIDKNEDENNEDDNNEDENNEDESKKSPPPMASVDSKKYQTNPVIERLIRENVRSTESEFEVTYPRSNQKIYPKNNIVNFAVKGKSTPNKQIEIVIYDNEELSFFNGNYIISSSKNLDSDTFSFNINIELEKGLYYYIISDKETGSMLYISKFNVSF